ARHELPGEGVRLAGDPHCPHESMKGLMRVGGAAMSAPSLALASVALTRRAYRMQRPLGSRRGDSGDVAPAFLDFPFGSLKADAATRRWSPETQVQGGDAAKLCLRGGARPCGERR